jgi:RHS repeat-associated protein
MAGWRTYAPASSGPQVGTYDPALPLVIDPKLGFASYLGGAGADKALGVAVDGAGDAVLTGLTASTNFPTTPGAYQTANAGGNDAFVTKLNAAGGGPAFSTYLGGASDEQGNGVALDAAGDIFVAGTTASSNFPTTAGAYQTSLSGPGTNAFVAGLNAAGDHLRFSSFFGPSGSAANAVAAAPALGLVAIAGATPSGLTTTAGAFQSSYGGGASDGFVAALANDGGTLQASTYVGGSGDDAATGVAVDPTLTAYVVGYTAGGLSTSPGAPQGTYGGGAHDAFVYGFDLPGGGARRFGTYLGGLGDDKAAAVAVDPALHVLLTGSTTGVNFPTTAGVVQAGYGGGATDAFVARLNALGASVSYATLLGGLGADVGTGVAADASGAAYVVGTTSSANFPTANAFQSSYGGGTNDAFVAELNPVGSTLVYSSYLGGSGDDEAAGVAVDPAGAAYVAGFTNSTNFPTANALQSSNAGGYDAFVAKVLPTPAPPVFTGVSPDTGSSSSDQITSSQNLTLSGTALPGATVTASRRGVGVLGSVTANAVTGVWSYDYSGVTLAEGSYSFTAVQTVGGVTSDPSADFPVTVDRTAPALTLAADAATAAQRPRVRATARDLNGLPDGTTVTLLVDVNRDGTYAGSATGSLKDGQVVVTSPAVTPGFSYGMKAQATDLAGNVGTSAVVTVTVNTAASWTDAAQVLTSDPVDGDAHGQLGDVRLAEPLDLDRSGGGQSGGAALVYNSDGVTIKPVVQATLQTANNASPPGTVTAVLTWNSGTPATFTYSTAGDNPGDVLTIAAQAGTAVTTAGRYPWTLSIQAAGLATQNLSGTAFVVPLDQGPLGAGWAFGAADRLIDIPADANGPAGKLFVYGTGGYRFFQGTGPYTSPANDAGTLTSASGGGLTTYTYSTPDGQSETFNSSGYETQWASADGQEAVQLRYDGSNRLTGVTAVDGALTTLAYGTNLLATIQTVNGRVVTLAYDGTALGSNLTQVTNPDGGVHTFSYDANHHLTGETLGGLQNEYAYGSSGALATATWGSPTGTGGVTNPGATAVNPAAAAGLTTPAVGVLTASETDPTGHVTAWRLDAAGRPLQEAAPDGGLSQWARDSAGRVTVATDPLGRATTYARDAAGYVTAETLPDGATASWQYQSAFHALTTYTDERGFTSTYAYDASGHQTSTTDALTDVTRSAYSASGLPTTVTDPLGRVTSLAYDSSRRLTAVTDALNHVASYGYDANGYRQTVTDPLGRVTTTAHDAMGRPTAVTDALGGVGTFTYDAAGLPLTGIDPLGHSTSTIYDGFHRGTPASSLDAAGTTTQASVVPTYDAAGRTVARRNPDGWSTSWTYDPLGRATGTTDALGDKSLVTYDLAGQLTATRDPVGALTRHAYNQRGWETSTTDALGNVTTTAYDAAGNVTAVTDPLGRTVTFQYDALSRLTGHIDPLTSRVTTTYDADSDLSTVTDQLGRVVSYGYDALNRRTMTTEAVGTAVQRTSTVAYDAVGNVTSATDPLGRATAASYDKLNRPTTTTDALSHTTTTAYDKAGNATTVTDPLGKTTTYLYDALNRRVQATDPLGDVTTLVVDLADNAAGSVDPLGNVTVQVSDALGRPIGTVDALGDFTRVRYDPAGGVAAAIDPRGNQTNYVNDALGRRVQTTDALGDVSTAAYDAAGNLTAGVDALSRRTTLAYDADHRLTQTTNALGGLATSLYDAAGNVTASLDELGRRTTFAYDALDRRTQTTDALGNLTTAQYDAADNLTASIDPLGLRTTFAYDALNRATQTTDPLGFLSTVAYDAAGNRTLSIDALGRRTTLAYDAIHRLTQTTNALGGLATTAYDAASNVTTSIDELGRRTTLAYDALNREVQTTDPLSHVTSTAYDAASNVTATIDALGNRTTYGYDALNRQTSVTDPGLGVATTAYDAAGNVTNQIDQAGDKTTYAYDALDRATKTTDPLGYVTTTLYDAVGNQTAVTDPDGNTTTFTYDALDRLKGQTDPLGQTTYAYDADSRQTSRTDPLGRIIADAYDADGRLTGETWTVSGSTANLQTFTYDKAGNQTAASDYSGAYTMAYDALNRVTVTQEPFGLTLTSSYDAVGNRTLVQDSYGGVTTSLYDAADRLTTREFGGAGQTPLRFDTTYTARDQVATVKRYTDLAGTTKVGESDYTYDAVGRVTNLQHKDGSGNLLANYTYTYDKASRLTSDTTDGATTSYGYDSDSQLTSAGASNYGYDPNGNRNTTGYATGAANRLTNDGTYTYTYDAAGELIKKSKGASAETWQYDYDARGRMTAAREYSTDGGALTFALTNTYDVSDRLLAQSRWTSSTGTVTTHFGWDGSDAWADLTGANALQTRYARPDGVNALEARVNGTGGTVNWLLTDRLGSERLVVNGAGSTLLDKIAYDAYGNIVSETAPTQAGPFGFAGGRQDRDLGAVNFWKRWLLTGPGRWTTEDPIGLADGPNANVYVHNDPTNATDPSGLIMVDYQKTLKGYGDMMIANYDAHWREFTDDERSPPYTREEYVQMVNGNGDGIHGIINDRRAKVALNPPFTPEDAAQLLFWARLGDEEHGGKILRPAERLDDGTYQTILEVNHPGVGKQHLYIRSERVDNPAYAQFWADRGAEFAGKLGERPLPVLDLGLSDDGPGGFRRYDGLSPREYDRLWRAYEEQMRPFAPLEQIDRPIHVGTFGPQASVSGILSFAADDRSTQEIEDWDKFRDSLPLWGTAAKLEKGLYWFDKDTGRGVSYLADAGLSFVDDVGYAMLLEGAVNVGGKLLWRGGAEAALGAGSGGGPLAAVARGGNAPRLVHLTDTAGKAGIDASGQIIGRQGIFAVPESVANESTFSKVLRTGLAPGRTTQAVPIPEAATELFKRPTPIGPYSAWKYFGGTYYAAPGAINTTTGAFTKGSSLIGPRLLIYGPDGILYAGAATAGGTYWYASSTENK